MMDTTETLPHLKQYNEEVALYITGGVVSLNRKVDRQIVLEKAKGSKLCTY